MNTSVLFYTFDEKANSSGTSEYAQLFCTYIASLYLPLFFIECADHESTLMLRFTRSANVNVLG